MRFERGCHRHGRAHAFRSCARPQALGRRAPLLLAALPSREASPAGSGLAGLPIAGSNSAGLLAVGSESVGLPAAALRSVGQLAAGSSSTGLSIAVSAPMSRSPAGQRIPELPAAFLRKPAAATPVRRAQAARAARCAFPGIQPAIELAVLPSARLGALFFDAAIRLPQRAQRQRRRFLLCWAVLPRRLPQTDCCTGWGLAACSAFASLRLHLQSCLHPTQQQRCRVGFRVWKPAVPKGSRASI